MAAPIIAGIADSTDVHRSGSTLNVNLPTGISSGDLILIFATVDKGVAPEASWQTGYTELYDVGSNNLAGAAAYRFADGTEGSTIALSADSSLSMCARAYRITGASTTEAPQVSTLDLPTNTNTKNPPLITPLGGINDYLYLALDHCNTYLSNVNTYPTGYINTGDLKSGPSGARCALSYATKSTTGSTSEDPSAFIKTTSTTGIAVTVAIAPAGGAPAPLEIIGTKQQINVAPANSLVDRVIEISGTSASIDVAAHAGVVERSIEIVGTSANVDIVAKDSVIDRTLNIIGEKAYIKVSPKDSTLSSTNNIVGTQQAIKLTPKDGVVERSIDIIGTSANVDIVAKSSVVGRVLNIIGEKSTINVSPNNSTLLSNTDIVGTKQSIKLTPKTGVVEQSIEIVGIPALIAAKAQSSIVDRRIEIIGLKASINMRPIAGFVGGNMLANWAGEVYLISESQKTQLVSESFVTHLFNGHPSDSPGAC